MPCTDTGFVHWELNPGYCDHRESFCRLTQTFIQTLIWHRSSLLSVFLGHLFQQPRDKMEAIKMWSDVSRVQRLVGIRHFLIPAWTSVGYGNTRRTSVPACPSHITATFHPCHMSHSTVLHTKCNFINLHASIHIDIHVYVWNLHFTAPSIWKIQKKAKHWLYI